MLPELMKYDGSNPAGWYLSEKLNGVRAAWNGSEFISKNGKGFAVPAELKAVMPLNIALDGELYAGGNLGKVAGLCRRKSPATVSEWQGVTFQVFDVADYARNFRERLELLREPDFQGRTRFSASTFVQIVPQTICRSAAELLTNYQRIKAASGEGLVLKSPLHKFRAGQSVLAQKIKYLDDFEINGCTFDETGRFICVRDYE